MSTESVEEYVNESFRPEIKEYLTGDYLLFLDSIVIKNFGRPAPTLCDNPAAVWVAEVPNHLNELGVLAVVADKQGIVDEFGRQWFCGVVPEDQYKEAKAMVDEDEFAAPRVALEHAEFGPFIAFEALDLLQKLYRR
ncbi:hypothetical protein KC960_04480 [Candidatus Saccharibacteria bacterium]|nr:hypothetical protein [Candidatus Saccharibacteria bacterium]